MKKLLSHLFRHRGKGRRENGQALVELALTLPLIVMLLCGVMDFGWIFANTYKVEYAAGVGARYASMNVSSMSSAELNDAVKVRVNQNLWGDSSAAVTTVTVDQENITVEVKCPVKTLTFVAGAIFGEYYNADVSATTAR